MSLLIRMLPRDGFESERAASSLELFFDLVVVVAISLCAENISTMINQGYVGAAIERYPIVFFSIWWAWISFTWFASAFDTDDWLYRVVTLVQMIGMLIMVTGITSALEHFNFMREVIGYIVMRVAMCSQWVRVYMSGMGYQIIALRYALCITLAQIGWVILLFLPPSWQLAWALLGICCELSIPLLVESTKKTPSNPHHLVERYGLFSLIVLGESIMSITKTLLDNGRFHSMEVIIISITSFIIVAGLWWVYFASHNAEHWINLKEAYLYAVGHYFVFSSAAIIATGIDIAVNQAEAKLHHTYIGKDIIGFSVAVFILSCLILKLWSCLGKMRKLICILIIGIIIGLIFMTISTIVFMSLMAFMVAIIVMLVEPLRAKELQKHDTEILVEI